MRLLDKFPTIEFVEKNKDFPWWLRLSTDQGPLITYDSQFDFDNLSRRPYQVYHTGHIDIMYKRYRK